ncbi:M14 family zinc carboxypeptidase [Gracilimonas sp. Q87]|uniref:M14 family metallopeptidase n=1 Tax=Gracilimonas sp. Q87 TaxID=3384766 RepID=UPI0039841D68
MSDKILPIVGKPFSLVFIIMVVCSIQITAQHIPQPSDVFGFEVGADYKLADYDQMLEYYDQLDKASDRVKKITIGESVLGRPMLLLFISSRENLENMEKYREISKKLSRARIDNKEALQIAEDGKAIVWIDGGMHATELAHGQMTSELAYRIATEESPEMQNIRENVITLLMPVMNPDGLDIVGSWYNSNLGTPFETTGPPWLYHHYVGHDNNRDWFMNNMPETYHVNEMLYNEWYPQIVYNHHQTAPSWARIFLPPFSDPVNPNIHPGITTGVNQVGAAMAQRFALEGKPGVVSDNSYTMFWNGGGRTTPYYHNQIGLLTETAHATPTPRFYDPETMPETIGSGIPTDGTDIFYPDPWKGGASHFRDAVDYMLTGSMAVLDLAAERKSQFLHNIYKMGRDAIEAGESGDPFAYIIPKDQWDNGEAIELINILKQGGVEIHQAERSFTAGEKQYPAGSFVIKAAQAYRPFVMDMMEPQNYPTRLQYPGGPPDPPYDLAGWTLPMQMGVEVDRINESFEFRERAVNDFVEPEAGEIDGNAGYGFVLSPKPNAGVKAMNRLLGAGEKVYRAQSGFGSRDNQFEAGSIIIENQNNTEEAIKNMARMYGLEFTGISSEPNVDLYEVKRPKVGLYKSWVANMDEGWTRWVLEKYEFDVDTLHDSDLVERDLSQYHSIIIPDQSPSRILNGHLEGTMPEEYTGGMGLEGALRLQKYVKNGGTLLAFDSASDFVINQFGLPVKNVVANLSSTTFFIPGSLIRAHVSNDKPIANGVQSEVATSFSQSRAFEIIRIDREGEGGTEDIKEAPALPIDIVVRYAEDDLLMSGWALGEKEYLSGKAALMDVKYGEGNVVLYGFRPQFRGQPHGTYKLIFNPIFLSTVD